MRKTITLLFLIFFIKISNAQFGCSPSTFPDEIFPPNSVTTSTNSLFIQYLCGPNTVLYDTAVSFCHRVYVENNCTLIFRPQCSVIDHIWLKSNATLNILDYFGNIAIHVEAGAVINHAPLPYSYSATVDTCSLIIYPYINCATGLIENSNESKIDFYPNPTEDLLNINCSSMVKRVEVANVTGQVLLSELVGEQTHQLQLQNFAEGIYFERIHFTNGLNVTRKIVVNH